MIKTAGDLLQKHSPSFVFTLAAVIRCPQNLLMLQLGHANYNLFILSGGSFTFHVGTLKCLAANYD